MSIVPLPRDILLEVFRLLPFDDVAECAFVSRQFYSVINSNWSRLPKIFLSTIKFEEMSTDEDLHFAIRFDGFACKDNKITFSKDGVLFRYSQSQNKEKLLISLRNFFKTRSDCLTENSNNDLRNEKIDLFYESKDFKEEISEVFNYFFKTFNVRGIYTGYYIFPSIITNSVINGICRATRDKASYTSLSCGRYTQFNNELVQLLKSSTYMYWPTGLIDKLHMFDTSYRCVIYNYTFTNLKPLEVLIEEWYEGQRTIKSFKAVCYYRLARLDPTSLKKLLKIYCASTTTETEEELRMMIIRPSDSTVLSVTLTTDEYMKANINVFVQSLILANTDIAE